MRAGSGLVVIAACGLVGTVSAYSGPAEQENYDGSNVITLSPTDFSEASIGSLPTPMLVDFYAPWCGHCKHLAPAYARAADMVKSEGGGMRIAKFDATTDHAVASKYGLAGYPTLVLFNEDGSTDNLKQLGPHNDAWIANWLRRRVLGTATKTLKTADDVKEFRAVAEVVCVLFSDGGDSQSADFESIALNWADPSLRWAIAPANLAKEFAPASSGSVVAVFRQTGEVTAILDKPGWAQAELSNFVRANDVPMMIRRIVLHSTWMHILVLLGERAADKHEHPYRQVYDFAAKGQDVVYESSIISGQDAANWVLRAGGSKDNMNLKEPTAAYIHVEKGVIKQVELYGKPLIGPGLTIGSKGDPGTATTALGDWSSQFGLNGDNDGGKKKSTEEAKKTPIKDKTKKEEKQKPMPQKNSMGASPHMKLGGANNHVHVLLKSDIDKLKARAVKQGVPAKDVAAAKSKEEVVALLYEYSDEAKEAGTLGKPSTTSKEIRAAKYDTNPIDPATGRTRIWQATVDAIKDPEEKAHAEAKYLKRDAEIAKGKKDEL